VKLSNRSWLTKTGESADEKMKDKREEEEVIHHRLTKPAGLLKFKS
jgi:hypothetical protein